VSGYYQKQRELFIDKIIIEVENNKEWKCDDLFIDSTYFKLKLSLKDNLSSSKHISLKDMTDSTYVIKKEIKPAKDCPNPNGDSVQCYGRTKKGHRCKRITTNIYGRCWQH
jgi:hypothetical protein